MAEHKLKMVKNKEGKSVPFFAADGKGKMMHGGRVKKILSFQELYLYDYP